MLINLCRTKCKACCCSWTWFQPHHTHNLYTWLGTDPRAASPPDVWCRMQPSLHDA